MNVTYSNELIKCRTNHIRQIFLPQKLLYILLIMMIIFIYFGICIMKISLFPQLFYSSSLDHSLPSHADFDVVLSYYAENVESVARFIQYLRNSSTLQEHSTRIIVYNKNIQINTTYLQTTLKADIVQQLPNIGREGETYLHHIIANYHALPNHILFSQAGVEGITDTGLSDWFSDRLEKQFNSSVGYMPLVENAYFGTFDCGVRPGEDLPRLAELWGIIEQELCPAGQQAVSNKIIFIYSD